jgi:diaminopimelate decarboxylase
MRNSIDFYVQNIWTKGVDFFGKMNPIELAEKYGTPLYVYNETILRNRCNDLKNILNYDKFRINYSAKANTNLAILRIINDEGLLVDAMSPGEIFIELKAGFKPKNILFICNNVSDEEIAFAIKAGVLVSVDSISQLARYGKINRGGKVAVRINPGVGAGHHEKVITGGKNTKFGVDPILIDDLKATLKQYDLQLIGINQHIGSLFMTSDIYVQAAFFLLEFAEHFPNIEFIDFGGGFGIPYHKESGEKPLDLKELGKQLQKLVDAWVSKNGKEIIIKVEPGRFTVAECGVLLGKVHSIKMNGGKKYIGTDIGFNVLARPIMYDSYHDIEIYGTAKRDKSNKEAVTIVGNICETGDIIAKDRSLSKTIEGDIVGILDAGAYGMVMSSNYNCRLRPAEILIDKNGKDILIRKRDELKDLIKHFPEETKKMPHRRKTASRSIA